ncbi:MAG: alpha/beta hydrolase-fold protein [Pirellulales bacterium]
MARLAGGLIRFFVVLLVLAISAEGLAQAPPDPNFERDEVFPSYQAFKDELNEIVATVDAGERTTRLNTLWSNLRAAGQVPYAQGNQYALLYRGSASTVAFAGDHNNWQPNSGPATRLTGTDLWMREGTLPTDARVDYKVVTNGSNWLLDPANPLQMWSGFGPNSELRMPAYEYPHETIRRPGVARGALGGNVRVSSANLGYQVQYRVYTPAGYSAQELANLPVAYVTDGHEYSADYMGSTTAVLDNLIADGTLRPTIAVFIDPRDPSNLGNNRRIAEYNLNAAFANFVAGELVPAIDAAYRTSATADDRVILGTSMGGLNSAYFGAAKGDVFHRIGIQSPAFSYNSSIYDLYEKAPTAPLKIFMTAGTINDGNGGPTMSAILAEHGYDYTFTQANEGHSWGNWRAQLADLFSALVGPPEQAPGDFNGDLRVDAADFTVWRDSLGQQMEPGRGADGNNNGTIDEADYLVWKAHFAMVYNSNGGQGGQSLAVPEPSAGGLVGTGLAVGLVGSRCRVLCSENSSCRWAAERRQLRGCLRQSGRN